MSGYAIRCTGAQQESVLPFKFARSSVVVTGVILVALGTLFLLQVFPSCAFSHIVAYSLLSTGIASATSGLLLFCIRVVKKEVSQH